MYIFIIEFNVFVRTKTINEYYYQNIDVCLFFLCILRILMGKDSLYILGINTQDRKMFK